MHCGQNPWFATDNQWNIAVDVSGRSILGRGKDSQEYSLPELTPTPRPANVDDSGSDPSHLLNQPLLVTIQALAEANLYLAVNMQCQESDELSPCSSGSLFLSPRMNASGPVEYPRLGDAWDELHRWTTQLLENRKLLCFSKELRDDLGHALPPSPPLSLDPPPSTVLDTKMLFDHLLQPEASCIPFQPQDSDAKDALDLSPRTPDMRKREYWVPAQEEDLPSQGGAASPPQMVPKESTDLRDLLAGPEERHRRR